MSVRIAFECPRCSYSCDAADVVGQEDIRPKPGDLSICLHCGAPLEFGDDMAPRWLTGEEFARLPMGPRRVLIQTLIGVVTLRPPLTERRTWRLKPA